MGLLEVDTSGLAALAADCQSRAGEIASTAMLQPSGPSWQSSAVAVGVVHAAAGVAAQALTTRLPLTAARLTVASADYALNEANSATQLRGLATEV